MAKLRIALVIVAFGFLAGCGSSDDGGSASNDTPTTVAGAASSGAKVTLKDLKFNPDHVSIKKGETVTWEWKESVLHNVTGEGFKSDNQSDDTFEHTFTKAGSYDYQCTLHSGMTGNVEVS